MDTGRNILSDDMAKALREIIEPELETGQVYVIPARGNCKTAAMKEALERAAEQAQQIKPHLTETRLTPSTEELLEGVRLPETPGTAAEAQLRAENTALRRMVFDAERKARREAARIRAKAVESTVLEKELARKHAPIIAVDFDGTLCENEWPGIGETKWDTVQALIAARAAGARLILWTNRVGPRLAEAVEWCRQRELEFDAVNENLPEVLAAFVTDCRKVYADIYLDDRAAQPSTAVLEQLWETARGVMNGAAAAAGEEEKE